uniref:Uncharacterized protein n=1 Tax=Trichogramma kaykai TaxID=54128 RepID=A0ABD2XDY0_9HYME
MSPTSPPPPPYPRAALATQRIKKKQKTSCNDMDDHEIQSTVEAMLGPDVKIIDCEKQSCVKEEEVLLINGVPITLDEPDGMAIREAMITGQVPPCDLLNRILIRAGIQSSSTRVVFSVWSTAWTCTVPVRLETSLNVKSSIVTKEEVTVARDGKIVDERSRETKENNSYSSTTSEIWEPIGVVQRPKNPNKPFDSSDESRPNSNASSDQGYTTNTSTNNVLHDDIAAAAGGGGGGGLSGRLTSCPFCGDGVVADCPQNCCLTTSLSGLGLSDVVVGGGDSVVDGEVLLAAADSSSGSGSGVGKNGKLKGVQTTASAVSYVFGIINLDYSRTQRQQQWLGYLAFTQEARVRFPPTIFGTVASDLNPKDGNSRRRLAKSTMCERVTRMRDLCGTRCSSFTFTLRNIHPVASTYLLRLPFLTLIHPAPYLDNSRYILVR